MTTTPNGGLNLLMANLLAQYEEGAPLLRSAVEGMTAAEVRLQPVPGKWSTLEVVCHLADFEIINADRIKRVIAEDRPMIFIADPDAFAARLRYDERDFENEMRMIESIRRHVADILRGLQPEQWERIGVHSTEGPLTIKQLVERVTNHIVHHVPFIAEKRAAMRGKQAADR
jgi:hypothetical protein